MKRRYLIVLIVAAGSLAAVGIWFLEIPYAQWETDDGTRHIVVRERWLWSLLPVTPGPSIRVPGSITAYDAHTGRRLAHKRTTDVTMTSEAFLNAPAPKR